MKTEEKGASSSFSILIRLRPWIIELWIAAVLVAFFLVRILGSSLGQRLLRLAGLRHLQ